mmetsp:Transcript_20460/g.69518  ORF Transcript_20460/g.69518 Transcript_20460/m.69518 type:complete len:94 (-) Transcript_20460:1294-1575(-)
MSGGVAYVYDPRGEFPAKCNTGMVALERVETEEESQLLAGYIRSHVEHTGSAVGEALLGNWKAEVGQFVKVMPHDYKRVLEADSDGSDAEAVA